MWLRSLHFTASVWVDFKCFLCICRAQQCWSWDCTRRTLSRYLNTTLYLREQAESEAALTARTRNNMATRGAYDGGDALLQDGRREEDVQRPLDLVGEAEGCPACGGDLAGGGVLWGSCSVSGACRL